MKITLKEFLKEQVSLGIKVPHIFEDMTTAEPAKKEDDEEKEENEDETNESLVIFNSLLEKLSDEDQAKLAKLITTEGFFGNIKNALSGTLEYQTSNNYAGTPEAQSFVAKDPRAKVQIETLSKKGMTPEEAKAAVMYVFDKNSKNPLGFVGKAVTFDPATKTLRVGNAPGLGAINNK